MPKQALIYAISVIAAGAGVAALAALQWSCAEPAIFLLCLGLNILTSTFKVRLPGISGTISPGFVFLLVAIGRLTWMETVAIGAAGGAVQCVWRAVSRPARIQVLFNMACLAICGGLAHRISHTAFDLAPQTAILVLSTAAIVLLVSNTMLVSAVVCLIQGQSLRESWKISQFWSAPYYFAGALIAQVVAQGDLTYMAVYLVLLALFVLHNFYGKLVDQFAQ